MVGSLVSCERKPSATSNTSEYREGKSGATSYTIENSKTDDPENYPAAGTQGQPKPEKKK